jgi:hypothetical protein
MNHRFASLHIRDRSRNALARYAGSNANFVLVVVPLNGLGAQSAPRRRC